MIGQFTGSLLAFPSSTAFSYSSVEVGKEGISTTVHLVSITVRPRRRMLATYCDLAGWLETAECRVDCERIKAARWRIDNFATRKAAWRIA
jgi:hypothetical protein